MSPTQNYIDGGTVHSVLATAALVAVTTGRHFHIGPWIIVPILILAAIVGTTVFVVRDHQRRRSRRSLR